MKTVQSLPRATDYPATGIGQQLRNIDTVMALPQAKVFYARTSGFDTHGEQEDPSHLPRRINELNAGLTRFIASLSAKNRWGQTIIYITSEFGRTNEENGSNGTDHGGATTGVIISPLVNGGVYGPSYNTTEIYDRELETDYRYVDVLSEIIQCMGHDPTPIFGSRSRHLGLFA